MIDTLDFPELLRLVDERSTAFRAAIAAAPSLDAPVPTCPGWTLRDLATHLGEGRFNWAATVAAGPDAPAKAVAQDAPSVPAERDALVAWLAASTRALLDALREAGPDRGCWVGWRDSQSAATCGAVARHQVQEIAVHTYDAQHTVGAPEPLPEEVALDGVEEFLLTCCATTSAWPHEPGVVDYRTTEGRAWRLRLSADGARTDRLAPSDASSGDATSLSTASDLVLWFYGRAPLDTRALGGDTHVFQQLVDWDPSA